MSDTALEFDHVAINVDDIKLAVDWYVGDLNATVKYVDETWAMLDVNGISIALTIPGQHPPHTAFRVNCLEDLGPDYHEHRDGSCYVYRSDPFGNTIELIYWRN